MNTLTQSPNPSYIDSAVTLLNERVVFPGDMTKDQIELRMGDLATDIENLNLTFDPIIVQGALPLQQEIDAWKAVLSLPPEKMQTILDSNKFSTTIH